MPGGNSSIANRRHSIAAVSADIGADRGLRVAGQTTTRSDDDDSVDCARSLCLCGDRREYPDPSPSYLVYAYLLPTPVIKSVTDFAKQSTCLYLFICCIIVGSILGMQRDVLIKGFLEVFVL